MDSMYKGSRKFTREQLVFAAEAILASAIDTLDASMPLTITFQDRVQMTGNHPLDLSEYERGAVDATGMSLAIIYAQLTGEGMPATEALACAGDFANAVNAWVEGAWKDRGKGVKERAERKQQCHMSDLYFHYPDSRKHAEAFVNECFSDYLAPVKSRSR